MNLDQAQADMRHAYFSGGPGVFASGLMWLASAIAAFSVSLTAGMITLFFAGMAIHPLAMLLSKALGRPGKHQSGNPLAALAMESTFLLFIGLFIAFVVAQVRGDWFYPIMLLIIGGRYLVFATLYGLRIYWLLGALLALAGMLCLMLNAPFYFSALIGAVLELLLAGVIVAQASPNKKTPP